MTASGPNIAFSVGVCAKYQVASKESHLKATKRIIRYFQGTTKFGLWYPFYTTSKIVGYLVANWVSDVEDHQSTSGVCFYIGNSLVSWHRRKQNSILLSTFEVEYIVVGSGYTISFTNWWKKRFSP